MTTVVGRGRGRSSYHAHRSGLLLHLGALGGPTPRRSAHEFTYFGEKKFPILRDGAGKTVRHHECNEVGVTGHTTTGSREDGRGGGGKGRSRTIAGPFWAIGVRRERQMFRF